MTSDAKVGLLLGLAFIFIIAFIINGLPNFKQQQDTNELTRNMAKPHQTPPGIGTSARKVNREVIERIEPVPQTQPASQPVVQTQPQSSSESVRFQAELPSAYAQSNPNLGVSNVRSVSNLQFASNVQPVSNLQPTTNVQQSTEPALPAAMEPSQAAETVIKTKEEETIKPITSSVTYTVKEGDSLADIAKSLYGPEEGNKRANIDRIFQANKKALGSPDQIYVGQKLIIPPLSEPLIKTQKTANVLQKERLQRAESAVKSNLIKTKETKDSSKYYVVKDGDHLWKIASEQLGNGNRYTEIKKLNKGILANEDHLEVGMRLKLPSK